ncbi:hypothetical protein SPF06_15125 [Sinomonas sp. JGH33]|uniref:Uncharacterized protein n=1 Tax=Sinomonas terricola TaxID=3110330 RepID=A0ABU5TAC7_9MICC|nr:hypothetical protein [Sinomonas sp. JGH33]MEA5456066.1 hypothetical protein [Sinomonas sp. JGH33]
MEEQRKPVNRRTVLYGAAWSAPVVVAAAATPLAAASGSGSIQFDSPNYSTSAGGTYTTITGKVILTSGSYPATVTIAYPSDFSGNITVAVNPATGAFSLGTVQAPGSAIASAVLTATAKGFSPGTTTLTVTLVPVPLAGRGLVWGYGTMNGTGSSQTPYNRPYAANPQKVVDQGWSNYRDVAQVGDEHTYMISPDGLSYVSFAGAAVTKVNRSIALNSGETMASLAGGPQVIAILTSQGRVFTSHYVTTNLTSAQVRNPAGVTFVQIAHFWSDVAGAVGLASDGKVYILKSVDSGPSPTTVKLQDGSDLTGVVEIAAGANPQITARKADGTVWSVRSYTGTSTANTTYAQQVWAGSQGTPLLAKSLAVHSSPYTDSSYVTAALGQDGLIWVWGQRVSYCVSGGNTTDRFARSVNVIQALGLSGVAVKNVSVSAPVFATLTDGRVVSFGNPADEGERGQGKGNQFTFTTNPGFVVDVNGTPITGIDRVCTTRGGGWAIQP